jgi:hypothetical protein
MGLRRSVSVVAIVGLVAGCTGVSPASMGADQNSRLESFLAITSPDTARTPPVYGSATSSVNNGSPGGVVQPGETLCGLVGPGDFAAVGLVGAGIPTLNGNGSSEAYCVYRGTSAGTGGLEFDAFTSDTASLSGDVYTTVLGESGAGVPVPEVTGVDAASLNLDAGGFATISVQAGRLVFDIGIPRGDSAKAQLVTLAKLVLDRSGGLR